MNQPPPGSVPPPSYGSPPPPPPPPGAPPTGVVPPGYTPYAAFQPTQLEQYAGFWRRFGGYLLDSLLYGLVAIPFVVAGVVLVAASLEDCVTVGNQTTCSSVDGGPLLGGILVILAGIVLVMVLYIRHLARTGQTWGRRLAGVRVVLQSTGQPIGTGKAIGRTLFAGFVSAQVFYLGYLWMLWDDNKQTWHDKIVGSVVVEV